jgi:hypothetical protein
MGSSAAPTAAPIVLLDANVLYQLHIRNILLQLAVGRILDIRWTDAIHDEWIGALVIAGKADTTRLRRTRDIMKRILPKAEIVGYEHRIAGLRLPDPDDRHVVAAAIECRAAFILTFNLRDFPPEVLAPLGIVAREPDSFLCDLYDADPEAVAAAVAAARENLTVSALTQAHFVDTLQRQRLPEFAARLSTYRTEI